MARPIVVSGADKHFFAMGCLLMHSLAGWAPDLAFYFLDFGLDDAQRGFLRERKVLIERPAGVPENLHPIVCKTAIGEYLHGIEWSAVLWLDSDMLVVGPLRDRLAEELDRMAAAQREVAACSVETINQLFAGGWPMAPFAEALRADRISLDSSYYNNATVVFRSPDFLSEWWTLAQQTPVHMCIDQNLFTLLALRHNRIMHLSARTWNLHGALLAEAKAASENGQARVVSPGMNGATEIALVLHPTSVRDQYHLPFNCSAGTGPSQILKVFRNPALRDRQVSTIAKFIADDPEALARAGMEHPGALLEAVQAHFPPPTTARNLRNPLDPGTWGKVGRLEACPCGSGKRYKHCHGQYA
jgi:hypothetical protein